MQAVEKVVVERNRELRLIVERASESEPTIVSAAESKIPHRDRREIQGPLRSRRGAGGGQLRLCLVHTRAFLRQNEQTALVERVERRLIRIAGNRGHGKVRTDEPRQRGVGELYTVLRIENRQARVADCNHRAEGVG